MMNDEDVALYRQAEQLAGTGQMQSAHALFCQLRAKSALPDVNVLVGIAYTTIDAAEAGEAIATIREMQPNHPQLASLQARHQRRSFAAAMPMSMGPALFCPYCGAHAPALIKHKTATAGWVIFVVLLIIFFPVCWIGFFFQEPYYACSRCGSKIAATR